MLEFGEWVQVGRLDDKRGHRLDVKLDNGLDVGLDAGLADNNSGHTNNFGLICGSGLGLEHVAKNRGN